jgi:SAM-dependent methyltransferase
MIQELLSYIREIEEKRLSSDEVPSDLLRPVKDYFRWKLTCEHLRKEVFPKFSFSERERNLVELKVLARITGNRRLSRTLPPLPQPIRKMEERLTLKRLMRARKKLALHVLFSVPQFLFNRWQTNYPEEFAEILSSLKRADFDGLSPISKVISEQMAIKDGDRVLEVGVGKGLKTSLILNRLRESGVKPSLYLGIDVNERKLEMAKELLSPIPDYVRLTKCDIAYLRSSEKFDWILLDAPCTGTGVVARKPEIRYRVTAESIERLSALQKRMLESALSLLKPEGSLVYSVCSIEPEEGRDLLRRRMDIIPIREFLLLPNEECADGFYFAVVRKARR